MSVLLKNLFSGKKFVAGLTLVAALLFIALSIYAHSKLLRSQPADGAALDKMPETIELTFVESVQKTGVNAIAVTDASGKRIDKSSVFVSEDGKKIWCELEAANPGIYKVEWKTLSADNHPIKGNFTFTVAAVETLPAAPSASPPIEAVRHEHKPPMQENETSRAQILVRWLAYVAMMTIFGGFAFLLLVLRPALRDAAFLSEAEAVFGMKQAENRFIRLTLFNLFLLAAAIFAGLILQTAAALDTSVTQAFAPASVFLVLTETAYGAPFLLQIFLAFALFGLVFFIARGRAESQKTNSGAKTAALWSGFLASALLFLAPSLTGHARATAEEFPFTVFSDWLHQIAGGVWLGGLFHLALTLPRAVENLDGGRRSLVLSRAVPFFSRLAVACAVLLAVTGIYNSWIHISDYSALWNTLYGKVLLAKIILFIAMLALGGINSFVLRPRVEKLNDEAISADEHLKNYKNFYKSLSVEAALGVIVLLLAAILAFLPPARHHETTLDSGAVFNEPRNYRVGIEAFQSVIN
jgi:copper transport protein